MIIFFFFTESIPIECFNHKLSSGAYKKDTIRKKRKKAYKKDRGGCVPFRVQKL